MEKSARTAPNQAFHVLITAAGQGARLGGSVPKQYQKIAGKALIRHTIEKFLACPGLVSLRVIIDPAHAGWYQQAISGMDLPSPIDGGNTRKISIFNGLNALSNLKDEDIILIHDAVRPLTRTQDILQLVHILTQHPAASLAVPVNDTLRRVAANDDAGELTDRSDLWAMQTPQGFHYGVIRYAHEKMRDADYTDDTSLVSAMGVPVKLVTGHKSNFKITTPDDLDLATVLLERSEARTGTGFDVHAFDMDKSGPVRLCGVDVPHDHALAGHSDADVGLHAITDALLGAIGAGDIGRHFPPSDPSFINMDSAVFLQKAVDLVQEEGGTIKNIDLTLICEHPKITPHAAAMIARVADITGLKESRISIKATTSERLGFTGRGEGIAAQAIASISLPWDNA